MEGSNLRPPRCERGALTTELTAPCRWDTLNYRHTHTPAQASQAKEQHSHNCVLLVRTTSFDAHRHTKKTNYWAVMPPSMTNSAPVTNDDSSDARYRIPAAMSSGWPMRPRGILATRSLCISGLSWNAWVMGESTNPGWTELARMFSEAYWMAVDLLKTRTAPLDAW